MNKKVNEATPKKQKRSSVIKNTSIIEEEKHEDEILPDNEGSPESEPDIDLELTEEPEAIETEGEIDGEELSDLLDVIEQEEESIDEVIDLMKDEDDPETVQKLLKYSDDSKKATTTSVVLDTDEDDTVEEPVDVDEEIEQKPKSRWLITTCRYCGNMYRFRSDQTQPPTCGRPKCVSRYEETSKKKAALIS